MDQSDEITQFEDDADRYNQEHSHLHYAPSHDPYHSSPNPPGFRFPNSRYRPFQSRQPAFPNSFSSHNQINSTENDFSESSFVAPAPRMIENAYDAYDQDMPAGPHNGAYHGPKVPSSSSTPQISVIRESNPQNSRGIRLRPVSDLPPTGSGKTVIFELSIIRMLLNSAGNAQGSKCVYMAPTKALCSERYRDWASKFDGLGIKCCELTGDTVQLGKGAWGDAKDASIILTRNWRDHDRILSQIQLFLVDEVHILNETRGSTLEVVISRMKARGTAVRFVTVSATVPNIDDVASWIGDSTSDEPALIFKFGEEFRPCQLKRFVYGFPKGKGQNDFTYAKSLSYRLFSILQQHIAHKPILVFCPTRNGVLAAAEQLAADFAKASESKQPLPWRAPTHVQQHFHDKRLEKLAQVGIGAHHAGLTIDDKRSVEDLYLNKTLPVVVATSTLAVGVNLPAHTVVINGVKLFQNGTSQEYSDLDIMQMMGRAGRPQFDKEGVAIIMCESELENKYKQLSEGRTLLESSLHRNLPEHLNSEVGLGTITDMESAKEWLHNSFLFRRIQKNPAHYAIGKQNDQTWQQRVDDMVLQSIEGLRSAGLLAEAEEGSEALSSTEYGDIMSKVGPCISISLPPCAHYVQVYNKIRDHEDIRFRIKKVEKASDKLFLLLQAVLGGISLNSPEFKAGDSQPHLEVFSVFRHVGRIARAVVEVALVKSNGLLIKNAQELLTIQRQLLNRKQVGFGHNVLAAVADLPQYFIKVTKDSVQTSDGQGPVEIELTIECGLKTQGAGTVTKSKKHKPYSLDYTSILTLTSDMELVDFRRIPTKLLKSNSKSFSVTAQLTKPSQSVYVHISSVTGVTVTQQFKPKIDSKQFPVPDTRPKNAIVRLSVLLLYH
ncbi:P-loop containing nucleoside triphosphate hydrolase protein [Dentipellis sp. KUC8613]|nr:P-loop containing nucleoside triphosphate hydrolase protein [Dentipellis sp. KUC8613]